MGKLLRLIVPIGILVGGGALFFLLSSMRTAPGRVERVDLGPLVETLHVAAGSLQVTVTAQGTVRPDREIDLVSQVAGVVEWMSPEMEVGGFFATGDLLARIDPRDYELVLEQTRAELQRTRYQLELERAEAQMATLEWQRLHPHRQPDPLVVRMPQVQAAEAALRASQARMEEAELRLERTHLRAPFDGRVRALAVDAGQYVGVGRTLARIYSIEKAEIVVPVPDEELAWIDVPSVEESPRQAVRASGDHQKRWLAPVVISARYAGRDHQWGGRVVRSEGELDPRSRMVRLVVEVRDPYGRTTTLAATDGDPDRSPLMVGLFCDVEIRGRVLRDVIELPRSALHAGDQVWTVTSDGVLKIHEATVIRIDRDTALVRLNLTDGERVITSQLKGTTDGMRVRVAEKASASSVGANH